MRYRSCIYPLSLISLGFIIGIITTQNPINVLEATLSKQIRTETGTFTNPLLECEVAQGTIDAEKINFKSELETLVRNLEKETSVDEIAVYFRDLNNGPTFGIHQDSPFIPASLLKVPVMMAYYHEAEKNPDILKTKLTFTAGKASPAEQTILPSKKLISGESYTTEELIKHMIVYSDNDAVLLLFETLPKESHTYLYTLLGMHSNIINDFTATLSVKQYAAFFRILFNTSFLSQENSEHALSLLSEIDFKGGLRKGIPSDISVAHKFGERQINTGERQLHDCGIVYYPKHPYLICIMTRGAETPTLERAVTDISEFVYSKIDKQYSNK